MASNSSNIANSIPEWLTSDKIKRYQQDIKTCPNPYTQEEIKEIPYDDPSFDFSRFFAAHAIKLLTKYEIPLTDEDDPTE